MGEAVTIKGTRNGLVILLAPETDINEVIQNLHHKMESARGFFKGARFTVTRSGIPLSEKERREVESICRAYGLIPAVDIRWPFTSRGQNPAPTPVETAPAVADQKVGEAVLHWRNLRSGQELHAEHHAVIVGDVHPGAIVTARESVFILGSCQGTVHAGMGGNSTAEVQALCYGNCLITIGGVPISPAHAVRRGPLLVLSRQ